LVSEKYIHTYKGIYLIGPLDLRVLKNLRTSSVYTYIHTYSTDTYGRDNRSAS
jgi:hypothetical protein